MENVRTIKISHFAPIPRGHRVAIHFFDAQVVFFDATYVVVQDLTSGIWYSNQLGLVNWVRGRGPSPNSTARRREIVIGRVRQAVAVASYGESGGAQTELDLLIEEQITGDVQPEFLRRQSLGALSGEIYGSDKSLEQVWPHGVSHEIVWEQPFTVVAHREPALEGPQLDVHLRLTQRREGQTHSIAVTLVVEATPELARLPAIAALHPRVLGQEAAWLLATVRYYAGVHGQDFPA